MEELASEVSVAKMEGGVGAARVALVTGGGERRPMS